MAERMYYIQDARQVVGNCALWWCVDGHGYTCDIEEAGKWPESEALKLGEWRETDIPFPVDQVREHVVNHVRVEHLHRMRKDPNEATS